ncbi:MAG: alanine racemase [Mycoplasmatales bacterium]
MFLKKIITENPKLIKYVQAKHQAGELLPDSYVIDVDTLLVNAQKMLKTAQAQQIKLFFMLKQIGRNPLIAQKLMELGFEGAVVVDYQEAIVMIENQIPIGNVGHLVQVPKSLLKRILLAKPKYFTVYSLEILDEINQLCLELNLKQKILLKVIDLENDLIYDGQIAGFELKKLPKITEKLKKFQAVDICGLTAFPCLLVIDEQISPTKNYQTIIRAQKLLNESGFKITELNLPSATSQSSLELLASLGATQAEPGHGLTGTLPINRQTNEQLAYLYLSEISHNVGSKSYCYGGGFYRRGNLKHALIGQEIVEVNSPDSKSIDYYFEVKGNYNYGESVIMVFRTQMFVTRSQVILVEGLNKNNPQIIGVYNGLGKQD